MRAAAAQLVLVLWGGAILARIGIMVLIGLRKIPCPAWFLFLLAHAARSIALWSMTGNPDAWAALKAWTSPYMSGLAILASLESFVLITWKIPRFLVPGLILAAVFAIPSLFAGWVSLPQIDTAAAAALAVFLFCSVTVFERFMDPDRRALNHAGILTLIGLVSVLSDGFFALTGSKYSPASSLISTGGTLAAYVLWMITVNGMDLTRRTPEPGDARAEMEALKRAAGL